jgi:hypothetical protein
MPEHGHAIVWISENVNLLAAGSSFFEHALDSKGRLDFSGRALWKQILTIYAGWIIMAKLLNFGAIRIPRTASSST